MFLPGIFADAAVIDFAMVPSGPNGGTNYYTLYTMDQNKANATINKFCYDTTLQTWVAYGIATNTTGGDGFCAATNGDGSVSLFLTTGFGGTPGNSLLQMVDNGGYEGMINISSSNVLYTVSSSSSLKGIAMAPVAPITLPTTITLTASNVTSTTATLDASVNPNGAVTTYSFNYGTTTGYGSSTPASNLPASTSPLIVTGQLTGLTPNTTYHYQVVATNSAGATNGLDVFFTTASAATPPVLSGISLGAGGGFQVAFTNATGLSFSVLATNDLTAPKSTWPVVGTAVESPAGSGNYSYTNPAATDGPMFYILRQP